MNRNTDAMQHMLEAGPALSLNGLRSVFPHEEIKHGRSVGERGRFGFVTEDNLQVGRGEERISSADYVEVLNFARFHSL